MVLLRILCILCFPCILYVLIWLRKVLGKTSWFGNCLSLIGTENFIPIWLEIWKPKKSLSRFGFENQVFCIQCILYPVYPVSSILYPEYPAHILYPVLYWFLCIPLFKVLAISLSIYPAPKLQRGGGSTTPCCLY